MIRVENEVRKAKFWVDTVNILLGTWKKFYAILYTRGFEAKRSMPPMLSSKGSTSISNLLTLHSPCLKLQ